MTAAAIVLGVASGLIFGAGPAFVAWAKVADCLDRKAEEKRRAEQDRQVSAEWLALLAVTEDSPIYDGLVCEQIEKAEGWING